jgi:hypothetical protein
MRRLAEHRRHVLVIDELLFPDCVLLPAARLYFAASLFS